MDKYGDSDIDTPELSPSFQLTALSYSFHDIIIIIGMLWQFDSEDWCQ